MYQLTNNTSIIRLTDTACIPADPANTDYTNYLKWVEEGNIALPYVEPPAPIPTVVTMVQARLALHQMNLLESVEAGISSMDKAAQIEWEFRATVQRESALVLALAAALQLDTPALDDLFILAGTL